MAGNPAWREAADRLHTHVVEAQLAHLETQYFRHNWLADLGPGPALLLVYLRSLCYHNPQTGETRDEVTVLSGELEQLFQKSGVTIRAWFARLDEQLGAGHPHGPFLEVVDAEKLPSQKVATTYRLNLLTPLHPGDMERYRKAPALREPEGERVTQEMATTPDGGGESFVSHDGEGHESSVSHVAEGEKRNSSRGDKGEQSFGRGLAKKWQPYKYYQDFFTACGVEDLPQLFEDLQQQHAWHLHDGRATEPFAAVAAGSLSELLDSFGIQEPARGQILRAQPELDAAVAWALYLQQEKGLANPAGYLIRRLRAEDEPPDDFLKLAQLSWEQWRVCIAGVYLHSYGHHIAGAAAGDETITLWQERYGQMKLNALPFGVGKGLANLDSLLALPDKGNGSRADASGAISLDDVALWRAVLEELSLQMTQATFASWLGDSSLVAREGKRFVISLRDEQTCDWVSHRLREPILRTLQYVTGEEGLVVSFVPATKG